MVDCVPHFQKNDQSKIVKKCSFPITGCNEADLIVTELGVFDFPNGELTLEEIAPEIDPEELKELTDADFKISGNLRKILDR